METIKNKEKKAFLSRICTGIFLNNCFIMVYTVEESPSPVTLTQTKGKVFYRLNPIKSFAFLYFRGFLKILSICKTLLITSILSPNLYQKL